MSVTPWPMGKHWTSTTFRLTRVSLKLLFEWKYRTRWRPWAWSCHCLYCNLTYGHWQRTVSFFSQPLPHAYNLRPLVSSSRTLALGTRPSPLQFKISTFHSLHRSHTQKSSILIFTRSSLILLTFKVFHKWCHPTWSAWFITIWRALVRPITSQAETATLVPKIFQICIPEQCRKCFSWTGIFQLENFAVMVVIIINKSF